MFRFRNFKILGHQRSKKFKNFQKSSYGIKLNRILTQSEYDVRFENYKILGHQRLYKNCGKMYAECQTKWNPTVVKSSPNIVFALKMFIFHGTMNTENQNLAKVVKV